MRDEFTFAFVNHVSSSIASAAAAQTNSVTLPGDGTYAVLEIVINGTTNVQFYIDGVLVATHTTVPSGGAFGTEIGIRKTAGIVARLMKADWAAEQVTFTSR